MRPVLLAILLLTPARGFSWSGGESPALEQLRKAAAAAEPSQAVSPQDRWDPAPQAMPANFPSRRIRNTPTHSGPGPGLGFKFGFSTVEYPATLLWKKVPIAGYPLGGALFVGLLLPALAVGGLGALIGSLFF